MGSGKKNTYGLLIIIEHKWNPLSTNFLFPQAVGDDMVNTCWTGSDFCCNCCEWNTECTFKDRFHLLHVAFIHGWCWGSTAKGIICLFPAILNDIHPSANSFLWRNICLWNFLQRLVTLLPNKTGNFIHVLTSVHQKLPCSVPWSTAKQQLTLQSLCTFVTAAIVLVVLHTWF